MRSRQIANGAVDHDVARAVLAIGRPTFPLVLMNTLREVADVDHCMVFSFVGQRSARCLLNAGDISIGADLGEAYSGHFHESDPNKETLFTHQTSASPIVLPTFARRMYSNSYWKTFFEGSSIVDKFATAVWFENTCFYVNFYKTGLEGCFRAEQIDGLRRISPSISAAVARHFAPAPQLNNFRHTLGDLLAAGEVFNCLTGREKEVCQRILLGYSSEAISADLKVSIHSILTYRRRAYDKLGISSQNELFKVVLNLLMPNPQNYSFAATKGYAGKLN